jgi:hypothetical protein
MLVEEVDPVLVVAAAVRYLYRHQPYHQVRGLDLLQGEPLQHHHLLHLLQVAAGPQLFLHLLPLLVEEVNQVLDLPQGEPLQLFFLLMMDYHKLQTTSSDLLAVCCPARAATSTSSKRRATCCRPLSLSFPLWIVLGLYSE